MAFGKPSPESGGAQPTGDDSPNRSKYGIPQDTPTDPLGVFDAECIGVKDIDSENFQGLCLEFKIIDDLDFSGEKVSLMAPLLETVSAKKRRGAISSWRRMGDACKLMGLAVDESCQPLEGWEATKGLPCRIAVTEYNGRASMVWGKPTGKFPDDLKVDGKHRDYGCGVLPPL